AVGFIMALLTLTDGHRLVVVPKDVKVEHDKVQKLDVITTPENTLPRVQSTDHPQPSVNDPLREPKQYIDMARSKNFGVLFSTVLLVIILISNVPLRGLWSVVILLFFVMMVLIFSLAGWWERITMYVSLLDIRINMGGYVFIAT